MNVLQTYYDEVVQPLQWAVLDIQNAGILVDQQLMREYHAQTAIQQKIILVAFEDALGYKFNPNSPIQVQETYDRFRLELGQSADKLSLLKCLRKVPEAKAFVEATIDYRQLGKFRGTYLSLDLTKDGRAHSEFRVYGTLTWRLSSRAINLQNLPREEKHGINIKDIYVAPEGYLLVELDYSQLEYRIPAYASRCSKLINIFEQGENPHFHNASVLFERPVTSKKGGEYDFAKRFKYAEGYGSGALNISNHMLADTRVWTEPSKVKAYLAKMQADTPEVYFWRDTCWALAKKESVLYEGFDLPRYLYGHVDDFRGVAYSWPTQATASGVINRALVRVYRTRTERPWSRVICQVHDSLLAEVKEEKVDEYIKQVKPLMEQPVTIFGYKDVVLPVEAKVGKRWGSMEVVR